MTRLVKSLLPIISGDPLTLIDLGPLLVGGQLVAAIAGSKTTLMGQVKALLGNDLAGLVQ